MTAADRKLVLDVGAWFGNVSTSVLIIFINKFLMNKTGYGFHYGKLRSFCRSRIANDVKEKVKVFNKSANSLDCPAATTLCACHYLACSIGIWLTQGLGYVRSVKLPFAGKCLLFLVPQRVL